MSFANMIIVGDNFPQSEYVSNDKKRGDLDFVMSRSQLVDFFDCPAKWRDGGGAEKESTGAMDFGSLVDTLALQPETFQKRYAVCPTEYPDAKTGEIKPWTWKANHCQAWREQQHAQGLECVKFEDANEAQNAASKLKSDKAIYAYLQTSKKQVFVTSEWQDEETGIVVPVKILIDLMPFGLDANSLGDLKTARSAAPKEWRKAVYEHGYHIQAALYLDVVNSIKGENRCEFRHIVQENIPPYQTAKRILDQEFTALGRTYYRTALALYAQCLKSNEWPDYESNARNVYEGWAFVSPDAWMQNDQTYWPTDKIAA